MDKIKVIAKEGTQCPKEGNPREYISDAVAEDVDVSTYYLRLINDGSLRRIKTEDTAAVPNVSPAPAASSAVKSEKRGGKF